MSEEKWQSPAGEVMDEAIALGIEERSPFPERSLFIDAEVARADTHFIQRAADEGRSVVVVDADRSTRVLTPEEAGSLRS